MGSIASISLAHDGSINLNWLDTQPLLRPIRLVARWRVKWFNTLNSTLICFLIPAERNPPDSAGAQL